MPQLCFKKFNFIESKLVDSQKSSIFAPQIRKKYNKRL